MVKTKSFNGLHPEKFPPKVPVYPATGKAPEYLYIKITISETGAWYGKEGKGIGDIYKVPNSIFWGFRGNAGGSGDPHFAAVLNEHGAPQSGISLSNCEILPPGTPIKVPKPEYTLEEIALKLGHSFKLKIEAHGEIKE